MKTPALFALALLSLVVGCDDGATAAIKVVTEALIPPVALVVAGVAAALGRSLLRFLNARFGTEEVTARLNAEALFNQFIDGGIAFAEQKALIWARDRGSLPSGSLKLKWAIDFIKAQMKEHSLPERARDFLVDRIEARLGNPAAPGESVRGQEAVLKLVGQPQPEVPEGVVISDPGLRDLTLVGSDARNAHIYCDARDHALAKLRTPEGSHLQEAAAEHAYPLVVTPGCDPVEVAGSTVFDAVVVSESVSPALMEVVSGHATAGPVVVVADATKTVAARPSKMPSTLALGLVAFGLMAAPLTGCAGQTAVTRTTAVMEAWAEAHEGTVQILEEEIAADLRQHCHDAAPAELDSCLTTRAQEWREVEDAVRIAASAQDLAEEAVYQWALNQGPEADPNIHPPEAVCRLVLRSIAAGTEAIRVAALRGLSLPIPAAGALRWEC